MQILLEMFDGGSSEPSCNHAIKYAGCSAPLNVAERRHPQFETQALRMFEEIMPQAFHVVLRTFGYDDDGVALAPLVSRADLIGNAFGVEFDFGDDDRFGAAGDSGDQRKVAAIAPHYFDQKNALVGRCRHSKAVDRFQCDVQCRRSTDRDVGTNEIVVDRRCNTDDAESTAGECASPCLGAVAADDDETIDVMGTHLLDRCGLSRIRLELLASGAPEHGSTPADDATHVARP